jgi:hypothetical protein
MLDQVAAIKDHLRRGPFAHVPIVANGVGKVSLHVLRAVCAMLGVDNQPLF